MNEKQVEGVVEYKDSIQKPQQAAVDETVEVIRNQIARLEGADATVQAAVVQQDQVVHVLNQAEDDQEVIDPLTDEARDLLANRSEGIDTDADGLSDATETRLSAISQSAFDHYRVFMPVALDPEVPDAEVVDEALSELENLSGSDPILQVSIASVEGALAEDEISEESPDTDGDGISDAGEGTISGIFTEASMATVPDEITVIDLDPTSPETTPDVPDLQAATTMVGGLETVSINLGVTVENFDRIYEQQVAGLEYLRDAQQAAAWELDIAGVAAAMGVSEDEAQRAVALFTGNCARCHTAGFSAGVPFTLEAGSGGFGPALWDGRPIVQFGDMPEGEEQPDLLVDFITNGSEAQTPYGLNGFGSGRMPAFGEILDAGDIELLAHYLRGGNLNGMNDPEPEPGS
jgi:mono/diheme cytochrome c family protein